MEIQFLQPPFDADFLEFVAGEALERNWLDISDTVTWLVANESLDSITEAVRAAWAQSSLPFRDWAEQIEVVEAWAGEYDLGLRVRLGGSCETTVDQCAPLSRDVFEDITGGYPVPIPEVLRELALTAPGISINGEGRLAHPSYFRHPMENVGTWIQGYEKWRDQWERQGAEFPDPTRHLIEVATTQCGDVYVLGKDYSVHFFDHEQPEFFPCRASVDELVSTYLRSPDRLINPIDLGWVSPRPAVSRSVEDEPSDAELEESDRIRNELPALGLIALAIRTWQRSWPPDPVEEFGRSWREHARALERIIDICRRVCVSGVCIKSDEARKLRQAAQVACESWSDDYYRDGSFYDGHAAAFILIDLVAACAAIDDWGLARDDNMLFETCILAFDKWDTLEAATIVDGKYLLSLGLGEAGTTGKPIPQEFFERPLWPDGIRL